MANLTLQNIAVAKLYVALFNRAPDASGFAFWVQAVNNGASLTSLAQTVLGSQEALAIYPASQTDAQFVTAFYATVFGRAPDAEGLAFWSAALAAQGGAGSMSARAALVVQITDIVSTPLTTKPAGLSDAAYAQAVADRARFANKLEFSVSFAEDLKINDLALAKSSLALITADPASVLAATKLALGMVDPAPPEPPVVLPLALSAADTAPSIATKLAGYAGTSATVDATGMVVSQLQEVAAGIGKIAAGGITGTLTLTDGLIVSQLTSLLGTKTDVATVNVDASAMSAAKLTTVSDGIAKVSSISNLNLVLNDVLNAVSTNLLPKTAAGSVTVVATGATAPELTTISGNIDKIIAGGITGTLDLSASQTATELGNLLSAKTGDGSAAVTVDAAGMGMTQLTKVGENSGKVDTLSNLPQLVLATLSASATSGLLGKAGVGTVTVDATSATTFELSSLSTNIAKVATNGITGTLALTATQAAIELANLLGAQTALAATVSVDADGMDMTKLTQVGINIAKVDTLSNLPQLVLAGLSNDATTGLLGKAGAGTVAVVASGATATQLSSLAANIDKLVTDGITGTLSLTNTQTASELGALTGTQTAAGATVSVNASNMDMGKLTQVGEHIAKVDTLSNLPQLVLKDLSDQATAGLLGKATLATVTVDATDATSTEVTSLLANLTGVANAGISGILNVDLTQLPSFSQAMLSTKLATAVPPVLRVIGDGTVNAIDVSAMTAPVRVNGGGGADIITLSTVAGNEVFIGGRAETRNGPLSGSETNTDNIDVITGKVSSLRLSNAPDAFGDGITLTAGSAFFGTSITANNFAEIWAAAISGAPASSSGYNAFSFHVNAGAAGLVGKTFWIVNDETAGIDGTEMMIAVVGGYEPANLLTVGS